MDLKFKSMKLISDPRVKDVFNNYPKGVLPKMMYLRSLILNTAEALNLDTLEETLKWGEPSYIAKKGSTLRMDWKKKTPDQYAMYFKCTSLLVKSFIEIHGDRFKYENHRAILFRIDDEVPEKELKSCIAMTLNYHNVKHLPLLGHTLKV